MSAPATDSIKNPPPTAADREYLKISSLRKEFDGFVAVDDVDITIARGEIFALLGGSGCGKSTLLRMLAGFEKPTAGKIELEGTPVAEIPPYRRPLNMMFQSYALFPHMSVFDNVAFGLRREGRPKDEIKRRVTEILTLVQMETFVKRKPHQLSGGQQQRVALARSLVKGPKVLLLDEPMGALDKKLRSLMQLELVNIIERLGVTCVMVTHDQEEAMTMANRIAIMDAGRIRQIGPPDEIYEQPNSRFVAGFIGSVNLVEGKIVEDEKDYVVIESPQIPDGIYLGHGISGFQGQEIGFALRPEKVAISKDEPEGKYNKARGVVEDIAYFGSHSVYHVRLPSGIKLMANYLNSARWASENFTWNDEVWLSWSENSGVVLTS